MLAAEGLALHLQRLAAEVVDRGERAGMPTPKRHASQLQRLTIQRLSLVELALGVQLPREPIRGEACVFAVRALSLEPCTE
eukprot:scaffold24508_cov66-Phaeocystis_antarctica.AAC.6